MQIEEGFRDTKSASLGFGLYPARSQQPARLQILLLLIALATTVAWLIGLWAHQNGYAATYQVNTVRDRSVLSFVFLGVLVLTDCACRLRPPTANVLWALQKQITQYQHDMVSE